MKTLQELIDSWKKEVSIYDQLMLVAGVREFYALKKERKLLSKCISEAEELLKQQQKRYLNFKLNNRR